MLLGSAKSSLQPELSRNARLSHLGCQHQSPVDLPPVPHDREGETTFR